MNFELTEEQRAFRTLARDFGCERVMPFARPWGEDEIFPSRRYGRQWHWGSAGLSGRSCRVLTHRHHLRRTRPGLMVAIAVYLSILNEVAWMIDAFGSAARLAAMAKRLGD